jgi:ubiquinone/menaquinone biosynthesis C-methylase UbiE
MEAEVEAVRLEEQAYQTNYSISEELQALQFASGERVMDAGCGTGVLCRYLASHYGVRSIDGLDFSDLRIEQARKLLKAAEKSSIRFHRQDLTRIDPSFHGQFDTVISRYVIEHVEDPLAVLQQLKKSLKEGGRLIIIEMDGVFLNLYSPSEKFNSYMREFRNKVKFDLEIGRKVPALMSAAGFADVQWQAKLLTCQGPSLEEERQNTMKRFSATAEFLEKLFESRERAREFTRLYLEELTRPENTMAFSKWICTGRVAAS